MRAREMHPLCCISIDCPALPDDPPEPAPEPGACHVRSSEAWAGGEEASVVGVLYKWTNFGKGWRSRWFSFRGGVLSYSKIPRHREAHVSLPDPAATGVRIIGRAPARLARAGSGSARAGPRKPVGVVHLKVSSFRESKSDDKRFYIFSPTMTLQLRTESKKDREAWIEALVSVRCSVASNENISTSQDDVSFSTEKLRDRMRAEGLGDALIQDCEQIMLSQFSEVHRHLKHRYEEHLCLLKTGRQQLQEVNGLDRSIMIDESGLQLAKHELSSSAHGKFGECSMTESSDEVEKRELDEMSDEDEPYFFDTKDCFNDSTATGASTGVAMNHADESCRIGNCGDSELMHVESQHGAPYTCLPIKRREELPKPIGKEKAVSLWSVIKDNVGKDLTRICLPVYFNEPLSSLQKCFEDLEYSYLLDQAYEYGKKGNSLMRILNVAAFAVSGYASSDGRPCKPFNPLLGETYESDYPEKGLRFFSEKVSHHPMLIACHCEGRGWKFWGDSNLRSKFWGRSIELEPVGILTLEFDDGEVFQWSKVTTTIYNLILGKVYCDHHGTMNIRGNRQYSCKLKFKEQSLLDRNPRQVQGFVEDDKGAKVSTLIGKWNDSIYYAKEHNMLKDKDCISIENASLLWKRSKPPTNATRYNFTSFAITLNELTSELKEKLPPTDSRLRPDQRHLENGEFEKANVEKLRLEKRQRMSRKLQESGWQPKWFQKDSKSGTYRYVGGYWEAKEQKKWDGCPNIFGDFSDDLNNVQDKQ